MDKPVTKRQIMYDFISLRLHRLEELIQKEKLLMGIEFSFCDEEEKGSGGWLYIINVFNKTTIHLKIVKMVNTVI